MTQTIPPTVLLTRPQAASERFAAELRAPVVISPLMETLWLDPAPLTTSPDAVVFTSENGVAGFARCQNWRGHAYCVGDRTAQAARQAGFEAESAGGDMGDLKVLLATRAQGLRLVHARGREVAGDLDGVAVSFITYEQRATALTIEARKVLGGLDAVIVPLFSPRSAALFAGQLSGAEKAPLVIIAMSPSVAQACTKAGLGVTRVAGAPDGESMLDAIEAARG